MGIFGEMINLCFRQPWNGQTVHSTPIAHKGAHRVSMKNRRDRFDNSVSRRNQGGAAIA
jgi:hypothetical protein